MAASADLYSRIRDGHDRLGGKKLVNKDAGAITEREAKNCMTGNLCRCTGYQPIIEAMTSVKPSQCERLKRALRSQNSGQRFA